MRKYVIMGVQGSGKGTQATMLAADLDLVHISVGDIFRWNVQHHTKLGAQVRRTMAAGLLVSDDLVEGIVQERLAEHDWNYGFIIDGFPRNERQAEFFLESYDIDGVIHLDLPDSEVRRRVLARRLCSGCGMDYNLIANSPHGCPAAATSAAASWCTREDDTEEALAVRLREYHEKTNPVLDIFRRKEYVVTVDARPDKEQVQQAIRERVSACPRTSRRHSRRPAEPMRVVVAPGLVQGQHRRAGSRGGSGRRAGAGRGPGDELMCLPLADGGEGTLQVLAAAEPAARWHQAQVTGPGGRAVAAAGWSCRRDAVHRARPGQRAADDGRAATRSARRPPGPGN